MLKVGQVGEMIHVSAGEISHRCWYDVKSIMVFEPLGVGSVFCLSELVKL